MSHIIRNKDINRPGISILTSPAVPMKIPSPGQIHKLQTKSILIEELLFSPKETSDVHTCVYNLD